MTGTKNPFTISFGITPVKSVERPEETNEIIGDFTNEQASNHIYMITGVRGAGKTVLLSQVARELQSRDEWVVVDLNPNRDMLHALAAKLYGMRETHKIFQDAKVDLSAFGIGVSIKNAEPISDIEAAVTNMMLQLKKHGKKVLITMDEAINHTNVRVFASSFQSMLREGLPVYLLMTGLYDQINALQNAKTLTFLYRAPKIMLEPLNLYAIKNIYQKTFDVSEEMAVRMARYTKGYPFALQALGYLWWRAGGMEMTQEEVEEELLPIYDQYLEDYSYEKIWSETTASDQQLLSLMAHEKTPGIALLREALSMSPQQFYRLHKRLVMKGIVNHTAQNTLFFVLPRFGEFILRQEMFAD